VSNLSSWHICVANNVYFSILECICLNFNNLEQETPSPMSMLDLGRVRLLQLSIEIQEMLWGLNIERLI
jgi:hypothetical protein